MTASADRIRLATAQSSVTCDPSINGPAVRSLMISAYEQGARLVQFPEGAISGYPATPTAKKELAGWHVDWSAVRRQLELTAELAEELRLWVILGGNHQLTSPHRPHNSLYVISDSGKLIGRYDKRLCSFNEITNWYSPGFEPFVFEIDGFRFGCALCIEINFPELFLEYGAHDVDCVLFSSFSEDPIFDVIARGHAATNNYWISVSVPAQCSAAMPAGVIGPHGHWLDRCADDGVPALVCVDLDRTAPELDVALHKARPWRARARAGDLYEARRVSDSRNVNRSHF